MVATAVVDPALERSLRENVAMACQILFRLGFTDYMGHASARIPGTDRVLIKPRHSKNIRAMGSVTPEKVVVIDLDGNLVEGDDPPPGERFIHTEIYKARPDVFGVVHTHQVLATAFGVVGKPILPLIHVEAPLVARGIPSYPSPELIHSSEQGAAVAKVLADYPVAHLQGHGIVTASKTVEEATIDAIYLERLARTNLLVSQIGGTPRVITPDEISRIRGPMVDYHVRWAYYSSLVENPNLPPNW